MVPQWPQGSSAIWTTMSLVDVFHFPSLCRLSNLLISNNRNTDKCQWLFHWLFLSFHFMRVGVTFPWQLLSPSGTKQKSEFIYSGLKEKKEPYQSCLGLFPSLCYCSTYILLYLPKDVRELCGLSRFHPTAGAGVLSSETPTCPWPEGRADNIQSFCLKK